MKKTWQWVIEYKRDLRDDSYAQSMVKELIDWRAACPKDFNSRLEIYACYLDWVALTQDQFDTIRYTHFHQYGQRFMKPVHLNECLSIIVKILGPGYEPGDEVLGLARSFRVAEHYRIRNVKTGEIIPGEIF